MNTYLTRTLRDWYRNPYGQFIALQEKAQLELYLPKLEGVSLLQLGCEEQINWLETSPIVHRIGVIPYLGLASPNKSFVYSHYNKLPFRNENFDMVLLPHTLEVAMDPKMALDEAWRILAPYGHLIILGFNRWGLGNILSPLSRNSAAFPQLNCNVSGQKLRHWLSKLGAEIKVTKSFCYQLPSQVVKQNWLEKIGPILLPHAGNIYIIIAKKLVIPLNVIKPRERWENVLPEKGMAEPTAGRLRRG